LDAEQVSNIQQSRPVATDPLQAALKPFVPKCLLFVRVLGVVCLMLVAGQIPLQRPTYV
jgi:hypothetical protein